MKTLFLLFLSLPAFAAQYNPQILADIAHEAAVDVAQGGHPVVVFDLDDTLIDTRERNVRILRDFAALEATRSAFPSEAGLLSDLEESQVHYLLKDTLAELGIDNPGFLDAATKFWLTHFFSNEYAAGDHANPGAASYARYLAHEGATIVYLTGRDEPRMGPGTRASLKHLHFPVGRDGAVLIMKPSAEGDDLQFKISRFADVAKLGEVIASFENEPANINAFQSGFPHATMVFVDTIHSPKPYVPNPGIYWIRTFRAGRP